MEWSGNSKRYSTASIDIWDAMYWHYIAFQTAVALAIFDSKKAGEKGGSKEKSIPEVTEAHLAQVVSMSTAFKMYIKATHEGYEDADYAYKLGNRYDGLNEDAAGWACLVTLITGRASCSYLIISKSFKFKRTGAVVVYHVTRRVYKVNWLLYAEASGGHFLSAKHHISCLKNQ